jgi:hypothetical protein
MIYQNCRNAARFTQRQGKALGLGSSEYEALHFIRKNGRLPGCGCAGAWAGKKRGCAFDGCLEQKGLITRTKDPRIIAAASYLPRPRRSACATAAPRWKRITTNGCWKRLRRRSADAFLQTLELLYQKSKWIGETALPKFWQA